MQKITIKIKRKKNNKRLYITTAIMYFIYLLSAFALNFQGAIGIVAIFGLIISLIWLVSFTYVNAEKLL